MCILRWNEPGYCLLLIVTLRRARHSLMMILLHSSCAGCRDSIVTYATSELNICRETFGSICFEFRDNK